MTSCEPHSRFCLSIVRLELSVNCSIYSVSPLYVSPGSLPRRVQALKYQTKHMVVMVVLCDCGKQFTNTVDLQMHKLESNCKKETFSRRVSNDSESTNSVDGAENTEDDLNVVDEHASDIDGIDEDLDILIQDYSRLSMKNQSRCDINDELMDSFNISVEHETASDINGINE